MGTLATRAVAVLALLALLAYPAAALKWQLISTLPANASLSYGSSQISLWPTGTGMLTLLSPKIEQYTTSNNGTTWSRLSNLYIECVFMAGGQAAFGLGQLAKARNSSKPLELLRWQKGKGWSVSLKPPAGSGAIGIDVGDLLVTDAGQTAFVLGTLLYKDGVSYTNERPAGNITQHIWRYKAATNRWTSIYKETYTMTTARGVTTRRKGRGSSTPHLNSLAASSGSLLWVGWAGQDAAGVPLTGRVSLWNGTSWKVVRQGAANEHATFTGVAPNRAWVVVRNMTSEVVDVWLYIGAQGTKKLTSKGLLTQISAPSTQFAVASQLVSTDVDPEVLRLWRWDEAAKSFKALKDVWNVLVGQQVNAASSKWVVLAGMEQDTSTTTPTSRLEAQVWNGSKWTAVTSLKQPSYARLQALVAVPPGGALVALGGVNENYGLWRLVA